MLFIKCDETLHNLIMYMKIKRKGLPGKISKWWKDRGQWIEWSERAFSSEAWEEDGEINTMEGSQKDQKNRFESKLRG